MFSNSLKLINLQLSSQRRDGGQSLRTEFLPRTWSHLYIRFTKCSKGVFSLHFPKIYSGPLIYSLLNWASLTQESCREMKRNERHVWIRVRFNWSRVLNKILQSSRKPNKQEVKMEHKTPLFLTGEFLQSLGTNHQPFHPAAPPLGKVQSSLMLAWGERRRKVPVW